MLVGAVHGYRGLVRELIGELKRELKVKRLPVVATGGYAKLMASKLPEISAVEPNLTLEGLRLTWEADRVPGHVNRPEQLEVFKEAVQLVEAALNKAKGIKAKGA